MIIGKICLKSPSITIILPLNNSSNTSVKSLKVLSIDSKVYQCIIDILSQIINVIKLYNQSFMCKSLYVKFDMDEKKKIEFINLKKKIFAIFFLFIIK